MPLPYVDPYPTTAEDRLAVILACWPCCRDEGKAATDRAIRELVAVAAQLPTLQPCLERAIAIYQRTGDDSQIVAAMGADRAAA